MFSAIWMLCGNCVGGEVRAKGVGCHSFSSPPSASGGHGQGPGFLPDTAFFARYEVWPKAVSVDASASSPRPGRRPSRPRGRGPSKHPVFCVIGPTHLNVLSTFYRPLRNTVTDHVPGIFHYNSGSKESVFHGDLPDRRVWLTVGSHLRKHQSLTYQHPGH